MKGDLHVKFGAFGSIYYVIRMIKLLVGFRNSHTLSPLILIKNLSSSYPLRLDSDGFLGDFEISWHKGWIDGLWFL